MLTGLDAGGSAQYAQPVRAEHLPNALARFVGVPRFEQDVVPQRKNGAQHLQFRVRDPPPVARIMGARYRKRHYPDGESFACRATPPAGSLAGLTAGLQCLGRLLSKAHPVAAREMSEVVEAPAAGDRLTSRAALVTIPPPHDTGSVTCICHEWYDCP